MKEEINNGFRPGTKLLVSLLIAYPIAIHATVINGYTVAALIMLFVIPSLLISRNRMKWPLAALTISTTAILILLAAVIEGSEHLLLYLMPIFLNTALSIFFGWTLLPGKTPLITRISILMRGKLEPHVVSYTRRLTQVWTFFFVLLALESLLLALFAPLEIWSLFTNILNYLLAGLLFTGEYFFRIRHLDDLEHPSFPNFMRYLSSVDPRVFNKQ